MIYFKIILWVLNTPPRPVLIIGGLQKFKIINKRGLLLKGGGSENIINANKWGWDGQLELAISKNKFVKRIVKTSTKHNNIFFSRQTNYKYTLFTHSMQMITGNSGLYSNGFSNIFEMSPSSKSSAVCSSAVSLLAYISACSLLIRILFLTLLLSAT